MAEANTQTVTPPATSGGITLEQVQATIVAALKPLSDALAAVKTDQKVLADTLAQLPPVGADGKNEKPEKPAKVEPLTAEAIAKLIDDKLVAAKTAEAAAAKPAINLPGTQSDGGTPPARTPVDFSKLNASQKVELGVKQLLESNAR